MMSSSLSSMPAGMRTTSGPAPAFVFWGIVSWRTQHAVYLARLGPETCTGCFTGAPAGLFTGAPAGLAGGEAITAA
jgi:hypothetical protein